MKRSLLSGLIALLLITLAGPAQAADTQLILATGGTAKALRDAYLGVGH